MIYMNNKMKLIQICNFYTYTEFFSSQHFIISHILRLPIPFHAHSPPALARLPNPSGSLIPPLINCYHHPCRQQLHYSMTILLSLTYYSSSAPITHPYTPAVYLLLPQYPLLLLLCHRYILKYLSAQRLLTH